MRLRPIQMSNDIYMYMYIIIIQIVKIIIIFWYIMFIACFTCNITLSHTPCRRESHPDVLFTHIKIILYTSCWWYTWKHTREYKLYNQLQPPLTIYSEWLHHDTIQFTTNKSTTVIIEITYTVEPPNHETFGTAKFFHY